MAKRKLVRRTRQHKRFVPPPEPFNMRKPAGCDKCVPQEIVEESDEVRVALHLRQSFLSNVGKPWRTKMF